MKNTVLASLNKLAGIFCIGLAVSTASQAGESVSAPVIIGTNSFSGSIGSTRNSHDDVQYIGCSDYGDYMICEAADLLGSTASCITQDPIDMAQLRSANDSAFMHFVYDTGSADCALVVVSKFSSLEPKKLKKFHH